MPDADTLPANTSLAARIPLGLATLVEIGCGDGALGAWMARRDPHCRRLATAPDEAAAARVAPFYDAVHVCPPGTPPPLPAGSAQLVVLRGAGADPAASIAAAAPLLTDDGILLVDLPNAAPWQAVEQMLRGSPVAIRPAAQAMTRDGLLAAVRAAGLVALDVPALASDPAARAFAQRIAPALTALGTDVESFMRRAAPARWLLRAARSTPPPMMLLAHVLKPVGGVNDVRVDLPLGAVATRPGIGLRIAQQPETPDLPDGTARILVLQRRLLDSPQAPAFVQHFRQRGWVVVQEFDDDPAHWPVIAGSDHFAFRGVHAVQTSTPRLEELFRQFNDEVAVFPNTVLDLPPPANFADPRRMTLLLAALRREQDTAPYIAALNEVLAEAGDHLAVEVVYDRPTFEALRTPHKRLHPILPYAAYRALMARCEIAFMPLADTRFNTFKSDLKFVEAGAHRLCCLASPVVYGATIRQGETGMIVATPGELRAALRGLVADPARALAMGIAARDWVRANRMMASQVGPRLAWYRSLWERRAELDAALLARAPRLLAAG